MASIGQGGRHHARRLQSPARDALPLFPRSNLRIGDPAMSDASWEGKGGEHTAAKVARRVAVPVRPAGRRQAAASSGAAGSTRPGALVSAGAGPTTPSPRASPSPAPAPPRGSASRSPATSPCSSGPGSSPCARSPAADGATPRPSTWQPRSARARAKHRRAAAGGAVVTLNPTSVLVAGCEHASRVEATTIRACLAGHPCCELPSALAGPRPPRPGGSGERRRDASWRRGSSPRPPTSLAGALPVEPRRACTRTEPVRLARACQQGLAWMTPPPFLPEGRPAARQACGAAQGLDRTGSRPRAWPHP